MSVLSQATTRLYQRASGPTNNESGAEVGNFFFDSATSQYYICADATPSAQVWNYVAFPVPVPVADGGTGASTLTGVLTGNGTSPVTANSVSQYSVLVGGALNAVSNVSGTGSAGQVLTSAGAGAPPTWASASGSGTYVLLQTLSPTSNQIVLSPSGYNFYALYYWDLYTVNELDPIQITYSQDNGSTYINSGYQYNYGTYSISTTASTDYFSVNTNIVLGRVTNNINYKGCSGIVLLRQVNNIMSTQVNGFFSQQVSSQLWDNRVLAGYGQMSITNPPINKILVNAPNGLQNAGSVSLYGLTV